MRIASVLPESSIDYPGKFGPVIFTNGCSFRCGYCHNPELIEGIGQGIDISNHLKGWKLKAEQGWYTGITISGGEPTTQYDLVEFVRNLRQETGLPVKLDTNGTYPDKLSQLLKEGLVDYVAMDVKTSRENYPHVVGVHVRLDEIERSMAVVSQFPGYEFRTTVVPSHHNEKNIREMGLWVQAVLGKKPQKFYLQGFKGGKDVLDSRFSKEADATEEYVNGLKSVLEKYSEFVGVRV